MDLDDRIRILSRHHDRRTVAAILNIEPSEVASQRLDPSEQDPSLAEESGRLIEAMFVLAVDPPEDAPSGPVPFSQFNAYGDRPTLDGGGRAVAGDGPTGSGLGAGEALSVPAGVYLATVLVGATRVGAAGEAETTLAIDNGEQTFSAVLGTGPLDGPSPAAIFEVPEGYVVYPYVELIGASTVSTVAVTVSLIRVGET